MLIPYHQLADNHYLCVSFLAAVELPDNPEKKKDLVRMSDAELRQYSENIMDALPDALSQVFGFDIRREFNDSDFSKIGEKNREHIEEFLKSYRDALTMESDQDRAITIIEEYDKLVQATMMNSELRDEYSSGFDFIIDQQRNALELTREGLNDFGYGEFYSLMDDFVTDIVDANQLAVVQDFYRGINDDSQQMMVQRLINSILFHHIEYLREHPDISDADDARAYAELYYELAEMVGNLLPQFMAVVEIVCGGQERYDDLKQLGLNDLLQKLESQKFSRFKILSEGIDRRVRNSIAHRDFKVDPVNREIEFQDHGEVVSRLTYSEFEDQVDHLLAFCNSIWLFRFMVMYRRLQEHSEAFDDIRSGELGG